MIAFIPDDIRLKSAPRQMRQMDFTWASWFVGLLGVTAVLGLYMLWFGASYAIIGWILYLIGVGAIFYRPRYGVYLLVFFSLAGDSVLMDWYPFNKNFSSSESLFYFHDSLIISPLESYLVLTLIVWLGQALVRRQWKFYTGSLLWPTVVFIAFMVFGLVYGIGTGGNINIALWEARPIFYLPLFLIMVSNLFTTRSQVNRLMWIIMFALFLEGLIGTYVYFVKFDRNLWSVEAITEHSAAIHMNTLFLFALAVWLYKGSWTKRFLLPLMSLPVLLTYLVTQRRSAFMALFIALAFMTVFLYRESRKVFWMLAPTAVLGGIMYLVIFWNNTGTLGLPAQAIKSVVAPEQASPKDLSSNVYRVLENVNVSYTIHQAPLTGVGFGKRFYFLVPLPDISTFTWWEYVTHNSVAWIWIKAGFGGFFAMMFLVGITIMTGIRVLWRMPSSDMSAVAATAVLYIIMHFIYAYVDMSWGTQSMVYVGVMMGLMNSLERIVAQPIFVKPKRWPWQPDELPPPGLSPLFDE